MLSRFCSVIFFLFLLAGCATAKKENLTSRQLGSELENQPLAEELAAASAAQPLEQEAEFSAEQEVRPAKDPAELSREDVQTALKNAGFYSGEIDGKFGPQTRKAIKEFQKANGLQVDGLAGKKTKTALVKYL
jgi:peptidoglycan hydrolase-like protein with peptidoglycan-binding domain